MYNDIKEKLIDHLLVDDLEEQLESSGNGDSQRVKDKKVKHLKFRTEGCTAVHHYANIIGNCLFIVLQMIGLREEKQQAIASLFKVTNIFTSGGDADIQASMDERKMEYGILLHRSGLMEMTKDAIEKQIGEMKHKFDETSKVRIGLI